MNKLIIMLFVILGVATTSCNKDIYNLTIGGSTTEEVGEIYNLTEDYINSHQFIVVGKQNSYKNGINEKGEAKNGPLIIKFRALDSNNIPTNNYVLIKDANANLWWKPEFDLGRVVQGFQVLDMMEW